MQTNEILYFRHACVHMKSQGELFVTSIKFQWISSDKMKPNFESVWNNIRNIQYTPANDPKMRAMLNLELIVPSSKVIFELIGVSKEECRKQLSNLKSIIKSIRNNELKDLTAITSSNKKGNDSSTLMKSSQPLVSKSSMNTSIVNAMTTISDEMKRSLLNKHAFLKKQYQDLVVDNKLLDDNDFWSTCDPKLFLQEQNPNISLSKGKLSSLYVDSIYLTDAECANIPEYKKKNILKMFPAIERVYANKDEYNVSEEDFWRRYAYSFRHDSVGIDDLFLRETANDDNLSKSTGNLSGVKRSLKDQLINPDSNLNEIKDDYYVNPNDMISKEYNDNTLRQVTSNSGLVDKNQAIRLLTGGWSEYNRQSKLILDSSTSVNALKRTKFGSLNQDKTLTVESTQELKELEDIDKFPYVSLNIQKNTGTQDIRQTNGNEGEDDSNVFVKSSNMVVRSLLNNSYDTSISVDSNSVLLDNDNLNTSNVLSTIQSVYPSIQHSMTFHQQSNINLHSLSKNAAIEALLGGDKSGFNDVSVIGKDSSQQDKQFVDGDEYSSEFKQEMSEIFVNVTERMRYFYVIISREGSQAPTSPESPSYGKVVGIIEDLLRINDQLLAKKTKLSSTLTG